MEPLRPIDELKNLKWAVASLVEAYPKGSYEREVHKNAVRGVQSRLDWVIDQLERQNQGNLNIGPKEGK